MRHHLLALLLLALPLHAEILAGIAKVDITDRTVPVNDPCFAKALVLKSGETTAVLITLDAVAIGGIGRIGNGFLANVRAELGHQSLYKVLPLAAEATPILIGTAKTETSPTQPVAWTRSYGTKKACIFYTSLGAPEDMRIADVRRLLVNAVKWMIEK